MRMHRRRGGSCRRKIQAKLMGREDIKEQEKKDGGGGGGRKEEQIK